MQRSLVALLSSAAFFFSAVPALANPYEGDVPPHRYTTTNVSRSTVREVARTYTVKSGDTLSKIDTKLKSPGPWTRLAYVNRSKFDNPDIIEVGTRLTIPTEDGKRLKYAPPVPEEEEVEPSSPSGSSPASSSGSSSSSTPSSGGSVGGSIWHALAQCESGGNWSINTGNGYYGGLQFSLSSWQAVGGSGLPSNASVGEQIMRGQKLQAIQGWSAWPSCSAKLGLR